jgi:putative membrane protein
VSIASTVLFADAWDTNGHMGGGWWIVMMFGMVFFWAAVILGIVWLVRRSSGAARFGSSQDARGETPIEILERRFAEGEISADEYRERREVITSRAAKR